MAGTFEEIINEIRELGRHSINEHKRQAGEIKALISRVRNDPWSISPPLLKRLNNYIRGHHGTEIDVPPLSKSLTVDDRPLPTIDTRAADRERERLNKQQSNTNQNHERKSSFVDRIKSNKKPVATGKHGRPLSPNRWNIKHPDGRVFAYQISANGNLKTWEVGEYDVPTYSLEQWRKMHRDIQHHIETRSQQPEDKKTMQKSRVSKLETLVAQARKQPESLSMETLEKLNRYLEALHQPLIEVPSGQKEMTKSTGWFKYPTFQDMARRNSTREPVTIEPPPVVRSSIPYNEMTGHQRAAVSVCLDPMTPGLERMTFAQMKALAIEQQQAHAAEQQKKMGLR